MGLRDYKKYKFEMKLKESEVISYLLDKVEFLEKKLAAYETTPNVAKRSNYEYLTDEEKKIIKQMAEKSTKPEDVIKQFSGELQEFNPHA